MTAAVAGARSSRRESILMMESRNRKETTETDYGMLKQPACALDNIESRK